MLYNQSYLFCSATLVYIYSPVFFFFFQDMSIKHLLQAQ